jgi:hypothetical protein
MDQNKWFLSLSLSLFSLSLSQTHTHTHILHESQKCPSIDQVTGLNANGLAGFSIPTTSILAVNRILNPMWARGQVAEWFWNVTTSRGLGRTSLLLVPTRLRLKVSPHPPAARRPSSRGFKTNRPSENWWQDLKDGNLARTSTPTRYSVEFLNLR